MTHDTPYYDLWQKEKARADTLEEELRQLREIIRPTDTFVSPVDLRPTERAYMAALLRAPVGVPVSHDKLMDASGSVAARGSWDDENPRKVTHVIICKLRKILAPLGVVIETVPWQGYRLPRASRDAWQVAIDRMNAETERKSA